MRYAVLALLSALWAFWLVALIATGPTAYYGWNLGSDGTTITYVTPGAPVYRAGIRVGDRMDWSTLPLLGRANLGLTQAVATGARLRVTVFRGTQPRTVDLTPIPWPLGTQLSVRLAVFAELVLMAMGIALVYLKPSRMTWGFLLGSLGVTGFGQTVGVWGQIDVWHFLAVNGTTAIAAGVSAAGILIFMSRFPADTPRGPLVLLDRIAVPLGAVVAILNLYVVIDIVVAGAPPPAWIVTFDRYLSNGLIIVMALAALVVSWALTKGSDRQRIVPVLIAFTLFVASVLGGLIGIALFTDYRKSVAISVAQSCSTILLAVAVANGVVRHRVVDVSFAISRTVVYTILTSILVGAFVLVDFVSNKVIEHFQVALFLEAAVALAFGIGLNSMHSRIDRFVDRTLFRRRHLAETRLRRSGRTLTHAESVAFIDEALVIEACDALELASAALFRLKDNSFVRILDAGWEPQHSTILSRDDHLVVNLAAELQPVDLAEVRWPGATVPGGLRQPLVAIPLAARHELLGFVLYGGHIGGEAIDPDEHQTLMRLADAATAAYEHVQAKTLLAESNALRSENAMLHTERDLLREMVETLRSVKQRVES